MAGATVRSVLAFGRWHARQSPTRPTGRAAASGAHLLELHAGGHLLPGWPGCRGTGLPTSRPVGPGPAGAHFGRHLTRARTAAQAGRGPRSARGETGLNSRWTGGGSRSAAGAPSRRGSRLDLFEQLLLRLPIRMTLAGCSMSCDGSSRRARPRSANVDLHRAPDVRPARPRRRSLFAFGLDGVSLISVHDSLGRPSGIRRRRVASPLRRGQLVACSGLRLDHNVAPMPGLALTVDQMR